MSDEKKIVVLVDDDTSMLDLYEHYFKASELGWKVFQNGYDALNYLRECDNVDAIILDLAMPTLDGLAVSQEIRRNENLRPGCKPVKIAYFTAYDKTKQKHRDSDDDKNCLVSRRKSEKTSEPEFYSKPIHSLSIVKPSLAQSKWL